MADFPSFAHHVKPLLGDLIKNVSDFEGWNAVLKTEDLGGLVLSVTEVFSDPLVSAIVWCLAFAVWVWFLSTITRNFSQVDRLWSILPVFFTWHFILHGCWKSLSASSLSLQATSTFSTCNLNARGVLLGLLTTVWGARLTYNYARKGGYEWNSEDYRWSFVRQRINWSIFEIINIIFISLYQCFLLMALAFPSYAVWYTASTSSLNLWDLFASIMFIGCLIGEAIADNQQWDFQNEKHKLIAKANGNLIIFEGDYSLGFLTHGLFRYSRHPNYFYEMGIWWSHYLFSIAAADSKSQWILNWTMIGALNLTILFQITTHLTEIITKKKYPMYELYRKNTSRLIPWFPGKDITKKEK